MNRWMQILLVSALFVAWPAHSRAEVSAEAERLVAALLGATPLIDDLRSLTDEIGGRPTGSEENRQAVEWGLKRFRDAGVEAWTEAFEVPREWLERSVGIRISGDAEMELQAAAMPYSTSTPPEGLEAPLVDGGRGSESDFAALGGRAKGAWVLVETEELLDLPGLFQSYHDGVAIERRAFQAAAAGVVYVGARGRGVLYRHNAGSSIGNTHPLLVLRREPGLRLSRLLRHGHSLTLQARIDTEDREGTQSRNVVAEIKGTVEPQEYVVIGAHLDSWDLGTGALDNGCNVALVIDLARQMRRLGIQPKRTIRFVLFNGEELGLFGSWGYVRTHASELDRHVMASSFDIGSGRITGFFTNGRPELRGLIGEALQAVAALGPFEQLDDPVVGTDNLDFLLEGVANLVANQESSNYGPNYHAETDTFDKVDLIQVKRNAAIAGAVAIAFATADADWDRQSRKAIEHLVESTSLGDDMRAFGCFASWEAGSRGRRPAGGQ